MQHLCAAKGEVDARPGREEERLLLTRCQTFTRNEHLRYVEELGAGNHEGVGVGTRIVS